MEVSINERSLDRPSSIIIGIVALIQGLVLYALHWALDHKKWPYQDWTATVMIATFILIVPTFITLSYRRDYPQKKYWAALLAIACLFLWIPWYGSHLADMAYFFSDYFFYVPLNFILAFIGVFFLKASMHEDRFLPSYTSLFGFSWHVFLSFFLAYFFTLIFWLILLLWGVLFDIVNIDFFKDLFEQKWFLYPVLSLAFAYAVVIFRTKINAIGAVQRILRALISLLLPLLLTIAVMFVVVLPFTGATVIWDKGYGSGTILGFVALTLFFFNAVFQDASEPAYGPALNKYVQYSIVVLIILVCLAAYGISLRVEQYGLTVDRLLVIIFMLLIFLLVLLYASITFFNSEAWKINFGRINSFMALLLCFIITLMFTPILDLSGMSVKSQLKRLEQGNVTLNEFDFNFLARNGPVGVEALKKFKENADVLASPVLSLRVEKALERNASRQRGRGYSNPELTKDEFKQLVRVFPKGAQASDDILTHLLENSYLINSCLHDSCSLLEIDLNSDSLNEYAFFVGLENRVNSHFFVRGDDQKFKTSYVKINMSYSQLLTLLENNNYTLEPPVWQNLKIGDDILRISNAH